MEKIQKYARVIRLFKEPCLSGLRYIFAKDAGALKPLDGSNPSGSAIKKKGLTSFFLYFFFYSGNGFFGFAFHFY